MGGGGGRVLFFRLRRKSGLEGDFCEFSDNHVEFELFETLGNCCQQKGTPQPKSSPSRGRACI